MKFAQKERNKTSIKNKFFIILLFILTIFILYLVIEPKLSNTSNVSRQILKANIRYEVNTLYFENKNKFDWTNVKIRLNKKYTIFYNHIEKSSSQSVSLSEFIDKKGNRFNIFTTKIISLHISTKEGSANFQ